MPRLLYDVDTLDLKNPLYDLEAIKGFIPHRHEFLLLEKIYHVDLEKRICVGGLKLTEEQFWVRGHIPGRPLFPGVLQLEANSQLTSVLGNLSNLVDKSGFFGLIGFDKIRFKKALGPGDDLILICQLIDTRHSIFKFNMQTVVDGSLAMTGILLGGIV